MSSFVRRPLLPKPPGDGGAGDPSHNLPPPQPHKREMVRVACQACRARKTKCDARRPNCSPCIARNNVCEYDTEADIDRYTSLKRKHSRLEKDNDELRELFEMIRVRPRRDAVSILDRVRATDDLAGTLAFIKQGDLLIQDADTGKSAAGGAALSFGSAAESLLAALHPLAYPPLVPLHKPDAGLGQKRMTFMQTRPGQDNHDLTQDDVDAALDLSRGHRHVDRRLPRVKASRWTSVTDEDAVVANLLSLYISWEHTTSRIFDENYFVEQLISGEDAYCSPLLVNAILAVATLNYKAIDPKRAADLSSRFRHEAQRLWHAEQGAGGLLIVPVSILLDTWCKANDEAALGHEYLGRGIQVARDLGLFDQTAGVGQGFAMSRQERKGRAIIAWGLFNWQALDSLVVHRNDRFSALPAMAIPDDPVSESEDVAQWDSFPMIRPAQALDRMLALRVCSGMCVILHQHIDLRGKMELAEDKDVFIEDSKAIFVKLLRWADDLPPTMVRSPECLPLVIDMHMYFHATIVELFDPFRHSDTSTGALARDVSSASLAQLRRLLYIQRYRYGGPPQTCTIVHPIHILTVDLLEQISQARKTDAESEFYIILCVDALLQISSCYPATRAILRDLVDGAKAAGVSLPEDVQAMFGGVGDAYFGRPAGLVDKAQARVRFELDLEMAVTDPSELVMEWLEQAAGRLKLR